LLGGDLKSRSVVAIVDHLELAEQAIFQIGRDFLRSDVVDEELAQPVIPEAHNHAAAPV